MIRPLLALALSMTAFLPRAQAAFSETSRRYLAPRDVFNLLEQKFPVLKDPVKSEDLRAGCRAIGSANVNLIGSTLPAIGAPAADLPMPGYVRWFGSCGMEITALQMQQAQSLQAYFPDWVPRKLGQEWKTKAWTSLSEDERRQILRYQVAYMIGPEGVIQDLGLAKGTDEIVDLLVKVTSASPTLTEAARSSLLALMLREEFISY